MSDLRAQVVEAMAQAAYEADYPSTRVTWGDLASYVRVKYLRKAVAVLDALLDVLGEQRAGWLSALMEEVGPPLEKLLAVLRDSGKTP